MPKCLGADSEVSVHHMGQYVSFQCIEDDTSFQRELIDYVILGNETNKIFVNAFSKEMASVITQKLSSFYMWQ